MSTEFYQEKHTNHDRTESVTLSVIRGCFDPPGSDSRCGVIIHLFNGLDENGTPSFVEVLLSQDEARAVGHALTAAGWPLETTGEA